MALADQPGRFIKLTRGGRTSQSFHGGAHARVRDPCHDFPLMWAETRSVMPGSKSPLESKARKRSQSRKVDSIAPDDPNVTHPFFSASPLSSGYGIEARVICHYGRIGFVRALSGVPNEAHWLRSRPCHAAEGARWLRSRASCGSEPGLMASFAQIPACRHEPVASFARIQACTGLDSPAIMAGLGSFGAFAPWPVGPCYPAGPETTHPNHARLRGPTTAFDLGPRSPSRILRYTQGWDE
jgi:hypothetical protein